KSHQLHINQRPLPLIYGAELQYFRLRGAYGKNVDRSVVIETWRRAINHMKSVGMNAVSFYIPWDFHEVSEGVFDFNGELDLDGDGKADYPSRDLHTFIKMIIDAGFRSIMVRPGPYINAEWGFLGFG